MSASTKNCDPAFQGAGSKLGTEIWRIENFQPVPLPKSDYGKFYNGDSYIILQTSSGRGGAYVYHIHFWIGKESTQDEAGTAAIKTVELDTALGGRAVQHRELQGFESDKFLSFFKPCIIPLEGGFASGFRTPEEEKFEKRLYVCKGKRVVRMKQVPFARSSLNHDDIFILDTEEKIYQFNGSNSNIQERGKALEVVHYLKDKYHAGTCAVAIIDDGNFQAEPDSGEFWVLFGGFAPLGRKVGNEDDVIPEATPEKLFSINDGQLNPQEGELTKSLLENNKCFLLDCGSEAFIWFGRVTQVEERKAACKAAEDFISENRPKATRVTRVIQGYETHPFKCHFESWPAGTGPSPAEEGRGKVAALVKQKGFDFKASSKDSQQQQEEVPPLLEGGGRLEVWRINDGAKDPVPKEDIGKFFCGDCYIVFYAYSGEKKEEYFLTCWLGKDSTQDDQMLATQLSNALWKSLKGKPTQGRIFQGAEPPQFIALFQPMVILKGGLSSGYKSFIAGKGLSDETYTSDGVALIQISSPLAHNNKAIQVDAVATSLNTYNSFILQSGNSVFLWNGSSNTYENLQWTARIAEFLRPGVTVKHAKEGTETSAFWSALGGKQTFTSKKITHDNAKDPHLYAYSHKKGKLEISEIYNYSQDDLLTEDMLILDTRLEVFVWTGHFVDSSEKKKAFEIGQQYIDLAVSLEGLSPHIPLYRIKEGHEPCFFTAHFSWDSAKATVQGNSFQKRLTNLFGSISNEGKDKPAAGAQHDGPTQRASALAALTTAFNQSPSFKSSPRRSRQEGSQRAAAVAALSSVLTGEQLGSTEEDTEKSAGDVVANKEATELGYSPVPEKNDEVSQVTHAGSIKGR